MDKNIRQLWDEGHCIANIASQLRLTHDEVRAGLAGTYNPTKKQLKYDKKTYEKRTLEWFQRLHFAERKDNSSRERVEIKKIVSERAIQHLCHFTQIKNLKGILKEGLLSVDVMQALAHKYAHNDDGRFDNQRDCICLSITFPNDKLFYVFRERAKTDEQDWCVLIIKPDILWDRDCAYTKTNAASRTESQNQRKGPDGFHSLFKRNDKEELPPDFTTDYQAEVLIEKWLPEDYIQEVLFFNEHVRDSQKDLFQKDGIYTKKFSADDRPFRDRTVLLSELGF